MLNSLKESSDGHVHPAAISEDAFAMNGLFGHDSGLPLIRLDSDFEMTMTVADHSVTHLFTCASGRSTTTMPQTRGDKTNLQEIINSVDP
jgi:hypothetical protein